MKEFKLLHLHYSPRESLTTATGPYGRLSYL